VDGITEKRDSIIRASDSQCCNCEEKAVVFWPMVDPDIPHYPYCRKCVDEAQRALIIKLHEDGLDRPKGGWK